MSPAAPSTDAVRRRALLGAALALLVAHGAALLARPRAAPAPPPAPAALRLRLDPNRASAAELALLPGIGPARARQIVAARAAAARSPAFHAPEDLDRIERIGPATIERLRPYLVFPDAPTPENAR